MDTTAQKVAIRLARLFVCPVLTALLSLQSCRESKVSILAEPPHESICILKENLTPLGRPNSIAIVSENRMAVCADNQVILYDTVSGEQLLELGHEGNGPFEYISPMIVRACGDVLYIWSASSLEFVTYAINGSAVTRIPFKSAISDFIPLKDDIIVYSNGVRGEDSVLDIYNSKTNAISCSLGKPTNEHKVLLGWFSSSPMMCCNGTLMWMNRDALDIYTHSSASDSETSILGHVSSNSFHVSKTDKDCLQMDHKESLSFLHNNSFVVGLFGDTGRMQVITSEGKYKRVNGKLDSSERFYSIYTYEDGESQRAFSFAASAVTEPCLFGMFGKQCYYLEHHLTGTSEEFYTLNRLVI